MLRSMTAQSRATTPPKAAERRVLSAAGPRVTEEEVAGVGAKLRGQILRCLRARNGTVHVAEEMSLETARGVCKGLPSRKIAVMNLLGDLGDAAQEEWEVTVKAESLTSSAVISDWLKGAANSPRQDADQRTVKELRVFKGNQVTTATSVKDLNYLHARHDKQAGILYITLAKEPEFDGFKSGADCKLEGPRPESMRQAEALLGSPLKKLRSTWSFASLLRMFSLHLHKT